MKKNMKKAQALNVTRKIIAAHLVEGDPAKDSELGIRIDQTLTQDATGTMAYLQFESMDVAHVRNELAVSYVDHNTVQIGFENADDHDFLASVAKKYGIVSAVAVMPRRRFCAPASIPATGSIWWRSATAFPMRSANGANATRRPSMPPTNGFPGLPRTAGLTCSLSFARCLRCRAIRRVRS